MNRFNPGPPKQPTGDPTRFLDQDDPLEEASTDAEASVAPPIEGELTPEEVAREFKAFNDQIRILLYESNHMQSSAFPVNGSEPAFRQPGARGLEDARKIPGNLTPPPDEDKLDFRALNYSLPEGEVYIRINSSRQGTDNFGWWVIWYPSAEEHYLVKLEVQQAPVRLEARETRGEYGSKTNKVLPIRDWTVNFHKLLDECQQAGDIPGDKFRY
jgi:hypothetical protein